MRKFAASPMMSRTLPAIRSGDGRKLDRRFIEAGQGVGGERTQCKSDGLTAGMQASQGGPLAQSFVRITATEMEDRSEADPSKTLRACCSGLHALGGGADSNLYPNLAKQSSAGG